jgi:dihydrofolate reductase
MYPSSVRGRFVEMHRGREAEERAVVGVHDRESLRVPSARAVMYASTHVRPNPGGGGSGTYVLRWNLRVERECIHSGRVLVAERLQADGAMSSGRPRGHTCTTRAKETAMGKIVITEFVSLDGVMEDPGGSENFRYGGWTFEISRGDEGDRFKLDETLASDALLLGRVTYEGFAAAWPSREGEFADRFNRMPKYVVSSTLRDPEWTNTTVLGGDIASAVAEAKGKHEGNIVVHGSARLVQALIDQDLVDELRLMVFPVILGAGRRLFGDTADKTPLRLVDSRTVGDGVAILTYEPDRD